MKKNKHLLSFKRMFYKNLQGEITRNVSNFAKIFSMIEIIVDLSIKIEEVIKGKEEEN